MKISMASKTSKVGLEMERSSKEYKDFQGKIQRWPLVDSDSPIVLGEVEGDKTKGNE